MYKHMKDYYEILGISKKATAQEIKSAYRKQALEWHPDRNKTAEATERFKAINKAYEVLSDSKKRETYDQYGPDAFARANAGGHPGQGYGGQGPFSYTYTGTGGNPFEGVDFGGFSDPFDIFEQFFGFQSPFSGGRTKRRDLYEMSLTFDEAIRGVTKEAVIKGKNHTIKIPAGVDDGMRVRFTDFDVQVRVAPDKRYRREGQDIYIETELSYPRAVLGGIITIDGLHGPVKLKVRPGTVSGAAIRLRGEGVPHPNSARKGDAYVVFRIQVPDRISGRAKKLLEELDSELV